MNIGEEICGEWLRHVKGCDFVQYNVHTTQVQGEIDVVGIRLAAPKTVYLCEVAVHLVTGLQYVKAGKSDNVVKLLAKFRKDVAYAREMFSEYEHVFMLWSPVVRNQKAGSANNQLADVQQVVDTIHDELGVRVQAIINERFKEELDALRRVAAAETKEMRSSVMRLLQVEEHLSRHLARLQKT